MMNVSELWIGRVVVVSSDRGDGTIQTQRAKVVQTRAADVRLILVATKSLIVARYDQLSA